MRFLFLALTFTAATSVAATTVTPSTDTAKSEDLKFFETSIRPLLAAECYDCHGPKKSKGGLRLDHRELILTGGESGPALVPGNPGESILIQAVHRTDPDFSMPPKK